MQISEIDLERFHKSYFIAPTGCWLWISGDADDYGSFRLNGKEYQAHRVSYEIHKGAIPEGLLIMHDCDCKPCVNPGHLTAGTDSQNVRDAYDRGRIARALSVKEVKQIKDLLACEYEISLTTIGQWFDVPRCTIKHIKTGRTWSRISRD